MVCEAQTIVERLANQAGDEILRAEPVNGAGIIAQTFAPLVALVEAVDAMLHSSDYDEDKRPLMRDIRAALAAVRESADGR